MIPLIKSTFYKEHDTKRKLNSFIKKAKVLSFGPKCQEFEEKFARWQGARECIMLNSGSSANLAIIQALLNSGRLKRGDHVAFSAITWSTNVMPLIQHGLIPIPVDIELDTLNVSSRTLKRVLETYPIKVLFLTNLLGFCDDIDRITALCKKRKILLIEDNCESLGTVYKGKKLGNYGFAASFSFYVGHHMSTVEGGAVVTNDGEFAAMLRLARAHGWDRNLTFAQQSEIRKKFRVNSTFYSRYTFYDLGYNFRPTEVAGFLGSIQLRYADEIVEKRRQTFLTLAQSIYSRTDLYYPIRYGHIDLISNFAVPVICRRPEVRDELVKRCDGKIEIRPIVGGDMVEQPFFGKYVRIKTPSCPNAKLIHAQGLYFGNNPELTRAEINTLKRTFADFK